MTPDQTFAVAILAVFVVGPIVTLAAFAVVARKWEAK